MGFKKSTFNVNFFLRKHKLLKNREAPICMRISVNCQAVDISIKRSVAIEAWNQTRESCTSIGKIGTEINRYVDTMRAKILKIHRELEVDGKKVTAFAIRDKLYGRDESTKTIIEIYADHNKRCRALVGKDFSISTVEKFDTSLNALKAYIKHTYKKDDILLREVDRIFIQDLDTPPLIKNLAEDANMSITKLQRLFKQVFGDSIFSYYQTFRIKEAARLLREEKLSVSEVGYQLGFTNLSHFSRVFAEHIGVKPKQYTKMK